MTYVKTGPFSNGTSPGISAQFLNNMENWIVGVDGPTAVSVNGSVSGSASLYQYLTGPAPKRLLLVFNNYKSGAAQSLVLPVPFTFGGQFVVGETQAQTVEFLSSGSAQTLSVLNTVGATGGTQSPETAARSWSFGHVRTGFDTIRLTFTTTASTGYVTVEGL